jgi:hypothetical protein
MARPTLPYRKVNIGNTAIMNGRLTLQVQVTNVHCREVIANL